MYLMYVYYVFLWYISFYTSIFGFELRSGVGPEMINSEEQKPRVVSGEAKHQFKLTVVAFIEKYEI